MPDISGSYSGGTASGEQRVGPVTFAPVSFGAGGYQPAIVTAQGAVTAAGGTNWLLVGGLALAAWFFLRHKA
jgi:hypothetical protein